jgi:hypothetical protein
VDELDVFFLEHRRCGGLDTGVEDGHPVIDRRTFLAGTGTVLLAAPLSKSAVSRVVATLKDGLEAWRTRSLADLDVIYVYLDGFALRVRSAGKVVSVPVLGVIGVFPDGHKHLLALDLCGGESFAAWKGCLDDLVARGLRAPVLAIIESVADTKALRPRSPRPWARSPRHKMPHSAAGRPRSPLPQLKMWPSASGSSPSQAHSRQLGTENYLRKSAIYAGEQMRMTHCRHNPLW